MSRDQLKEIVKECLVEILSEGVGNAGNLLTSRRSPVTEQRTRRPRQDYDPRLDSPVNGNRQPTSALKDAIKREAGGNPIMESIFADTARTTLPSQMAGENGSPGSQTEQFSGEPDEVFGEEVSSRWANLAFMNEVPKK